MKSKQESELNELKEKLSKAKEKCDKGISDSAELQSGKDKVTAEIAETDPMVKTEKFSLNVTLRFRDRSAKQDNRTNSHMSH